MIFVNLDAGVQQAAVERAGSVVEQGIFHPALQQQHHPDSAPGGVYQGVPKTASREEIGVGDDDFAAGGDVLG